MVTEAPLSRALGLLRSLQHPPDAPGAHRLRRHREHHLADELTLALRSTGELHGGLRREEQVGVEARRTLNQDGAVYVGARAVVIPAHTGTTGAPSTRQVVVASDHKSFTLDDGHAYERLSGTVWAKRYSVDIGTLLVRQAYTEGAELFESLWRSATDPAPRTPEEIAAEQEQFLVEALRAHHRIPPWGRPDFSYDLARARDALAGMATDFARIPKEKLWAVLEHYRRTDAEIAGLSQPVGPDCLTTDHGTCGRCRPVLVWAWVAERRWTHHNGDPSVVYDVEAILATLERLDPDHSNTPGQVLSQILDEHHHPPDRMPTP